MIKKFFELLKPYSTNELTKIRLGKSNDGGYVVAKELIYKSKTLISFGIGNDISFEEDFSSLISTSNIRCYDHTIDKIDTKYNNITLFKEGLNNKTISLTKNNPDTTTIKIDIEGNEWDILNRIYLSDQIIIEIHILPVEYLGKHSPYFTEMFSDFYNKQNQKIFDIYYNTLNKVLKTHFIFHIHANNSLPKITIGEFCFPPLLELTLINKNIVDNQTLSYKYPDSLDMPNKTDRPDIINIFPFEVSK